MAGAQTEVDEVRIHSGDVELAGTVWTPAGARQGVVMHPGSGPSDRHNDDLFPPIRELLLGHGVAVASFDKRGVGGSGGSWLEAGIVEQAEDAAAAVAELRARVPGVPVGLFGHSQGGWVVLEAAERSRADWVITNSGPAVSPIRQEGFSTADTLRGAGLDEPEVVSATTLAVEILQRCASGMSFDDFVGWRAGRRVEIDRLVELGVFVPDDPALWGLIARMGDYDPLHRLKQLSVPLLTVFGSEDNVVPVEDSVAVLRSAVAEQLLTVAVIEGGDHRMGGPDGSFAPGYFAALTGFLDRVGPPDRS